MGESSIAVVIVSFNRESYLRELLQSLLNQDDKTPFELVIFDNGSAIPLERNLTKILGNFPGHVTVLREEKNLLSPVRWESAISAVNSDFILCPGDDDIALPNYISTMRALTVGSDSISMISSGMGGIDSSGRLIPGHWKPTHFSNQREAIAGLLNTCGYSMPSSGFRRESIDFSKIPLTRTAFDWALWLNSWVSGDASVTDQKTILYRQHDGQEQHSYGRQKFHLDAARMLTEFVLSERFEKLLKLWTPADVSEFSEYLMKSSGPSGGETRWGPLIQILVADQLAKINAPKSAIALHTQASAQAGIVPDTGTLQALSGISNLQHIPKVAWSRVPIGAEWESECYFVEQWRTFLSLPDSKSTKINLVASCKCQNENNSDHELKISIQRIDTQDSREIKITDIPSSAASLEMLEIIGQMTGRKHGFELVSKREEQLLRVARKIRHINIKVLFRKVLHK